MEDKLGMQKGDLKQERNLINRKIWKNRTLLSVDKQKTVSGKVNDQDSNYCSYRLPKATWDCKKWHNEGSKYTFLKDLGYTWYRMFSLASLTSFTQKNDKNV